MADTQSELDEYFPRDQITAEATLPAPTAKRLGIVVAGSLSKGLDIKLDRDARIEDDRRRALRRRAERRVPLLFAHHRRGARQHQPPHRKDAARRRTTISCAR